MHRAWLRGEVETLLAANGFDGTGPVDVLLLADRVLGEGKLRTGRCPGTAAHGSPDGVVYLRRGLEVEWTRYFCAREIGRIYTAQHAVVSEAPERDLDYFAQHVLVPRRALAIARERYTTDLVVLAAMFIAPVRVMSRRCDEDTVKLRVVLGGGAINADALPPALRVLG